MQYIHWRWRFVRFGGTIQALLVSVREVKICENRFKIGFFSGQCYRRQMQPLSKSNNSAAQKVTPHSIRLVEIPWTKGNKGGIRLTIDENQKGAPISASAGCPGVRISE